MGFQKGLFSGERNETLSAAFNSHTNIFADIIPIANVCARFDPFSPSKILIFYDSGIGYEGIAVANLHQKLTRFISTKSVIDNFGLREEIGELSRRFAANRIICTSSDVTDYLMGK